VAIVVDCPGFLPRVSADPTRLRQIMINLGTNALKFTQQGEVRLFARFNGRELSIGVRDTGIGVPEEDLPLLFEEFTEVGHDHPRRGSGLGLSIVKHLTELHGGQVHVESQLGYGSVFSITLPAQVRP
jgi:signal transduction histidine kinase